jgi:hypothetical protein
MRLRADILSAVIETSFAGPIQCVYLGLLDESVSHALDYSWECCFLGKVWRP